MVKNVQKIKIHFIGFWPSFVLIFAAMGALFFISFFMALDLLFLAAFYALALRFVMKNIKVEFEESQLTVRYGILNVQSFNFPYNKIQSTIVQQDFLGRILDFADVIIVGMGQSKLILHEIKHPYQIQKIISEKLPQQVIEVTRLQPAKEKASTSEDEEEHHTDGIKKIL